MWGTVPAAVASQFWQAGWDPSAHQICAVNNIFRNRRFGARGWRIDYLLLVGRLAIGPAWPGQSRWGCLHGRPRQTPHPTQSFLAEWLDHLLPQGEKEEIGGNISIRSKARGKTGIGQILPSPLAGEGGHRVSDGRMRGELTLKHSFRRHPSYSGRLAGTQAPVKHDR